MSEKLSSAGKLEIPQYEPEISIDDSPGGQARALWAKKFSGLEKMAYNHSQIVYTDIGGAFASEPVPWANDNPNAVGVKHWGDGLEIPPYYDLKQHFGKVPQMIFLVASPRTPDQLDGLVAVAEEYRHQKVSRIIAILGCIPHERQDHKFTYQGSEIRQPIMLDQSVKKITSGAFDAAIALQLHSTEVVKKAAKRKFPILPLDAFKLLIEESNIKRLNNGVIVGPDKGRRNVSKMIASYLQWPQISCNKDRARTTNGLPTVWFDDPSILELLQGCEAVMVDDEIREAGTSEAVRELLEGWIYEYYLLAVRGLFAFVNGSKTTAAQLLARPLNTPYQHEQIIVTDAVEPVQPITEIENKLKRIHLRSHVDNLFLYLQKHLIPHDENWLRDPEAMQTSLRLDCLVE